MEILIVEDYIHTRKTTAYGLKIKLQDVVISEAENGQSALNYIKSGHKPDVILMDISMPVMNGIDATLHIKNILPDAKVIMLTSFSEKKLVLSAFKSGANAYCLKNIKLDELVIVIRSVLNGAMWIDPAIAQFILEIMQSNTLDTQLQETCSYDFDLTSREKEVLALAAEGANNKEIAEKLVLREVTVKSHLNNIFKKLNVTNRTQAVLLAMQTNLIK